MIRPTSIPSQATQGFLFDSEIGWIGVQWAPPVIRRIWMGYPDRQALARAMAGPAKQPGNRERDLAGRLRQFVSGVRTSLSDLEIDTSWMTDFQRQVVAACRQIPWGETLTYGQLATIAGSPGASRAVGTVMAQNRYPLVVPCHRVVASNGIGGFSAPCGLELKQRLLASETEDGAQKPDLGRRRARVRCA